MRLNPNHPFYIIQQNQDQILIFQEENKNGESGSHLLPTKDDVKKVVGSEVRKTKLSTIYSLYVSSGEGGDWCAAQQAEDGEGWERRCRWQDWEGREGEGGEGEGAEMGKEVKKWLKGLLITKTTKVAAYVLTILWTRPCTLISFGLFVFW